MATASFQQIQHHLNSLKERDRLLARSRLSVGATRKPIRIVASYTPQNEVALYQPEGALSRTPNSTKEAFLINNCWNSSWAELQLADLKQNYPNFGHGIAISYPQNYWGLGVAQSVNFLRLAENATTSSSFEPAEVISKGSDEQEHKTTVQAAECTGQQEGIRVLADVLFRVIQRCINERNLAAAREVHHLIRRYGFESDAFLGCHLIRMFAFFELLPEANLVFSKLTVPNAFAWSAIISAHAKLGQNEQAIKLYNQMRELNVRPDGHVFVAVLKACATEAALKQGREIHMHIIDSGLQSDIFVCTTLVHMYSSSGSLKDAHTVFDRLSSRNKVIWNALIAGYAQHGHCQEALHLFRQMQQDGLQPDKVTFVCILKACHTVTALKLGEWIHTVIIGSGLELDLSIGSTLVHLYANCERFEDACILFDKLPKRDVVTWSALIAGYGHHGFRKEALHLFQEMQDEGMQPTPATYTELLKVCASTEALKHGRWIHGLIIESGVELDEVMGNTLIEMYIKCKRLQDAHVVFDSMQTQGVISWSVLIAGFTQNGYSAEALQLFEQMQNEGMQPDPITVVGALKACSSIADLQCGKQIHTCIIEMGWESDLFVGSTLVDMYAKCGSLDVAGTTFDRLTKRDVVTWTALISGFADDGHGQAALCLFQQMQKHAIKPDGGIFLSIIKACSSIAALEQGKEIHAWIIRQGLESDLFVCSTLMDMYSKCGSLQDALMLFDRLPNPGMVTWSALIAGYAQHGDYEMAFQYFERMQQSGLKPDGVAFLCLLSACRHLQTLDKGCLHFKSMILDHGIRPMLEHFTFMVDLFGHAECLNEAEDLLETIPFRSNVVGWTCLLSSCRKHGSVDVGRRCFDHVVAIDQRNAAAYVLMAKTYAGAGMRDKAGEVEATRLSLNAWKKPAKAFIEIDNQVHDFVVGDKTHPRSEDIYAKLKALSILPREKKYISQADLFMNQIFGDDRESFSAEHSEKLAIAFGLISTPKGATIRVSKNVRVCADCHIAAQIMSKVEMREIFVNDTYRIHHFKDGACSCNDYHQQE